MNPILTKFFASRGTYYLVMDRHLIVREISPGLGKFADHTEGFGVGQDVRMGFPELIGMESLLDEILHGRQNGFELIGVTRVGAQDADLLYVDIYISRYQPEVPIDGEFVDTCFIILFEDATTRMMLEQKLMQSSNEASLLLDALSASSEYVQTIIDSMADALLVTTLAGQIKVVNRKAQQLFEYDSGELIGRHIAKIIQDSNFIELSDRTAQSWLDWATQDPGGLEQNNRPTEPTETQSPHTAELACKTKSGKSVTIAFSRSLIQTPGKFAWDNAQDIIYVGRDITQQRKRQQRLDVQYAIARILSEAVTLEQAATETIATICTTMDWDLGELWLVGRDRVAVSPPNLRSARVLQCVNIWAKPDFPLSQWQEIAMQTKLSKGKGFIGRIWASRQPQWINISANPNLERQSYASKAGLKSALGFPIHSNIAFVGLLSFWSQELREIDPELMQLMATIGDQMGQFVDRKRTEAELLESEERYRDLFESAIELIFENCSDLIQWVNAEGRFVYVNPTWKKTLGYADAEAMTMRFNDIVHPDWLRERSDQLTELLNCGGTMSTQPVQLELVAKDGTKIYVEGIANCQVIEGNPVAIRAIFHDITPRIAATAIPQQQSD